MVQVLSRMVVITHVGPIYSKTIRYIMLTLSNLRVRLIVLLSVLFIPAE